MRTSTLFALIVILIIFGVGGYFYFRGEGEATAPGSTGSENPALAGAWQFGAEGDGSARGGSGESSEEEVCEPSGALTLENAALYENAVHGFWFLYPREIGLSEFSEGGGEVVLAEGKEGSGFQVFILPWDEEMEVMTPERVHQDLPDMKIMNPQTALLPWGKRVLIFESEDAALGRTREVWMVHGGQLYQITTALGQDANLARVMETWRFFEE